MDQREGPHQARRRGRRRGRGALGRGDDPAGEVGVARGEGGGVGRWGRDELVDGDPLAPPGVSPSCVHRGVMERGAPLEAVGADGPRVDLVAHRRAVANGGVLPVVAQGGPAARLRLVQGRRVPPAVIQLPREGLGDGPHVGRRGHPVVDLEADLRGIAELHLAAPPLQGAGTAPRGRVGRALA